MRRIAAVIAILASSVPVADAAATVTGKVMDDRKRPITGATVWIHIRPSASGRPKPYSAWTRSGPGGVFRIAQVPVGDFVACAQLRASPYVDGCFWGLPRVFRVTAATAAQDLGALELRQGHQLRVRIDDPRGELYAARKSRKASELRLGVWSVSGSFCPLEWKHQEPNGQEYAAVVPYNTPVRLIVQASRLRLADQRGAAVDNKRGFQMPLTIQPGKEPPMIRLQVVRINPGTLRAGDAECSAYGSLQACPPDFFSRPAKPTQRVLAASAGLSRSPGRPRNCPASGRPRSARR